MLQYCMEKTTYYFQFFGDLGFVVVGCWGFLGDCGGHIWRMFEEMLDCFSYSFGGVLGCLLDVV